MPGVAAALNMITSGTWDYVDGSEVEGNLAESYLLGLDQGIDLTQIMSGYYNLRYSFRKDTVGSNHLISPAANLDVGNYIFSYKLSVSGSFIRSELEQDLIDIESDTIGWTNTIKSTWKKELWPDLSFTYGETYSDADRGGIRADTTGSRLAADMRWNHKALDLFYGYSRTEATDDISSSHSKSYSHLGRLDYRRNFASRGTLAFNQTYAYRKSTFNSRPDADGTILVPVVISDIRYGEDDTPETGAPPNNGNPPNTIIIRPANERMNISLQVNGEQVNAIYLYTSEDIRDYANDFVWDLYSSSDGVNWNLEQLGVDFVPYNFLDRRFECAFPAMQQRYVKLVADTDGLLVTDITEIVRLEAFRRVTGSSDESSSETSRSMLTLGYQLSSRMRLGYSFEYSLSKPASGEESTSIRNNASLNWFMLDRLTTALTVSDLRSESGNSAENRTTNYTLSLSHETLPTLRNSLNFSHSRRRQENEPASTSSSAGLQSTASLYNDLDGLLSLVYATSDNPSTQSEAESLSAQLRLTARLSRKLSANLITDYGHDMQKGTEDYNSQASLGWRLSEFFLASFTAGHRWGDMEPETHYTMTGDLAFSQRMRGSLGYGFSDRAEETSHNIYGNLDLIISKLLTFFVNGFYTVADEDSWGTSCLLRFNYNSL